MKILSSKVTVKTRNEVYQQPVADLPVDDVINRIEKLNEGLAEFWSDCDGWAPVAAAGLLGKSRLDWQVSLSASLRLWIREDEELSPAELILAWANLGSLLEGTIKLLLSVYYQNYIDDIENLKTANAYDKKKNKPFEPDGLTLGKLKSYCKLHDLPSKEDLPLMALVQMRRNAIHAFQDKPLGTDEEFQNAVRDYLQMLRNTIARLPYPDQMYVPLE